MILYWQIPNSLLSFADIFNYVNFYLHTDTVCDWNLNTYKRVIFQLDMPISFPLHFKISEMRVKINFTVKEMYLFRLCTSFSDS